MMAMLHTNPGTWKALMASRNASIPDSPVRYTPTAGTGSEITLAAVITDPYPTARSPSSTAR